jgi:hypothetical protein
MLSGPQNRLLVKVIITNIRVNRMARGYGEIEWRKCNSSKEMRKGSIHGPSLLGLIIDMNLLSICHL